MSLTLSLPPFTVLIARPYVAGHDRRILFYDGNEDTGAVEYSRAGTPRIMGSPPKYRWEVQAFLTEPQWRVLQALHRNQRRLEEARQSFGVVLLDKIREQVDPGARERAIVPETAESFVDGGGVAYYASYSVRVGAPTAEPVKNPTYKWRASWSMSELEVIAP